jgi:hypothetical protein
MSASYFSEALWEEHSDGHMPAPVSWLKSALFLDPALVVFNSAGEKLACAFHHLRKCWQPYGELGRLGRADSETGP